MEAEAERRRRAEVLQSEGDRQSEVNLAQGVFLGRNLDGFDWSLWDLDGFGWFHVGWS